MRLRKFISMTLLIILVLAMVPAFDISALAASTPYYIEVDITNQIVTIYSTADKSIVRQMLCSTGLGNSTPLGTYTMPSKQKSAERTEWYYFRTYDSYAKYATRVYKGIMFHSIPYNSKSESSISKKGVEEFGFPASHGCIRLRWQDAEFIAQNCLKGTKVKFFESGERDDDLRELLLQSSYTGENGMTYQQFLGIPEEEGALGRFCEGAEVQDLQYRLRDLGIYDGDITGEYRSATVNAVKQVQELLGQEQTGIATLELQEIIYSSDAPTAMNVTLQEGMSGPVVGELQENLHTLCLYNGDMDSVYDVDVTASVKLFQSAYGYPTNGVADSQVQKAIYYEAGKVEAIFSLNAGYELEMVNDTIYMGRVSSEVGIRIRERPTTESEALGRLTDGDYVLALEYGDPWSKIQHGDCVGYMKNVYLKYFQQDISALRYTATDDDRVYTIGYTAEEYQTGVAMPAAIFSEYLATEGSLEDYEGLVEYATVSTENDGISLNLRESPSTNGEILSALPYGTQVKVLLRSSEWTLVSYNDLNGYLLNQYLEFWTGPEDALEILSGDQTVGENEQDALFAVVQSVSADKAPVYDVDSDDANVLGHLTNGIDVEVLESINGWNLISYQGHTGYMKDEDLRFVVET